MAKKQWETQFIQAFNEGVKAYRSGVRDAGEMFDNQQVAFLGTIGCTAQELYDFVEDQCDDGEPSLEDIVAMTTIRQRYFQSVQHGIPSQFHIDPAELPPKDEPVGGLPWLPRIIAKARAKLRGELDATIMYGCGGDRSFLRKARMKAPEFLQLVWDSGNDDARIVAAVQQSAGISSLSAHPATS
ncbi:MAG TPA: hypothetical protein DCY13_24805 [Verrucomicrobiales bacterium]|nr:hypothetical protein [Verrucomicrobiales bacterium]